ncbi:MAG: hypothetical protein J6Z30_03465 [Pyramidobacter sp.]|nr:hypothetical protein [Pyramidobacter sp.]
MGSLEELMSPERLKRMGVLYACVITRYPGECYLAAFADQSRLRVLDLNGGDAEKRLAASLEAERSLLHATLGGGTEAYVRGVPFGMAESFLTGLIARRAPSRMLAAVFTACTVMRELHGALTPTRGLFAELRRASENPPGYTIWLDGTDFPIGG